MSETIYTSHYFDGKIGIVKSAEFRDSDVTQKIRIADSKQEHISTNPNWSDERYEKAQTAFCSEPDKLIKSKFDGYVIEGLNYDYSDRLREWDSKKSDQAWKDAKGENYTAAKHESYLCNYLSKDIELVHLIAGINHSNGYPYLVYGYRDK